MIFIRHDFYSELLPEDEIFHAWPRFHEQMHDVKTKWPLRDLSKLYLNHGCFFLQMLRSIVIVHLNCGRSVISSFCLQ